MSEWRQHPVVGRLREVSFVSAVKRTMGISPPFAHCHQTQRYRRAPGPQGLSPQCMGVRCLGQLSIILYDSGEQSFHQPSDCLTAGSSSQVAQSARHNQTCTVLDYQVYGTVL